MVKKLTVIVLALILGMGSIISFTSRVSALDAGKIWLNDDDTVTYATINDAVAAGNTGDKSILVVYLILRIQHLEML